METPGKGNYLFLYVTFALLIFANTANSSSFTFNQSLHCEVEPPQAMTNTEAARFLQQATFGPSPASIEELKTVGYEQWIDQQIALPVTRHLPILVHKRNEKWRWQAWSIQSTYAEDQLRQRMAFAFSQIMTVSLKAVPLLYNYQAGTTHYYDTLLEHSLGDFRQLLEAVARHPVMGIYLTYKGNRAGERPDENFAREIMQLFTIGLVELNMNGLPKLDSSGNTIAAYNQEDIEQFSKIFTGMCYEQPMNNRFCNRFPARGTFERPMQFFEQFHDQGSKQLLNDLMVPSEQGGDKDLAMALDNLAYHPNTAPFISTLLIKRLVTSNPSPEYIERVASIFAHTKGDLAEVARAILLDPEARHGQHANTFGKLREPLIRMTHLFRALDATMPNVDQFRFGDKTAFYDLFGQAPFHSPSVFNFFMPDYSQGDLQKSGLVGPEFQILNTSQLLTTENLMHQIVLNPAVHYPNINIEALKLIYQQLGVDGLIGRIDELFTSGLMSASMKGAIKRQVELMNEKQVGDDLLIRNTLAFVVQSPEFAIQR